MNKKIISIILVVISLFLFVVPSSALSHSTYSDLSQSNTTVQNLISFANNYDSFHESKFVVYNTSNTSTFIVWGDSLTGNQNNVTSSSKVYYIEYSRNSDMQYSYKYSFSDNFSLNVSDVIISNIPEVGMTSQLFEDIEYRNNFSNFSIACIVFLFVILLFKIRKG